MSGVAYELGTAIAPVSVTAYPIAEHVADK